MKLPAERVAHLVAAGQGEPFAPAGRVFREWVAAPRPDRRRWRALLAEARDHAAGTNGANAGGFPGFGRAGLVFLAGLARDNTKGFFDAHRAVYRNELLEPAKAFVVTLGAVLRRRAAVGLQADPRVGGSLFRIANDLRFARDQPPYKPHLDVAFWEGPTGPRRDPALIVRITPTDIHLGCGQIGLTGAALAAYRTALHDPARVTALDRHVTALLADGAGLSEPTAGEYRPASTRPGGRSGSPSTTAFTWYAGILCRRWSAHRSWSSGAPTGSSRSHPCTTRRPERAEAAGYFGGRLRA